MLRAFVVDGGLSIAFMRAFDEPDMWGLLLVDIARHAARAYARESDYTEDEALSAHHRHVRRRNRAANRHGQDHAAVATRSLTMPINILMPALSPTMEKGNLAKWLKKEGDKVKSGDVIAEIETDKATMEVEAVDEGTIAKIVVPEGTQDVPVNDVIAVLAGDGEDVKAAGAAPQPAPKPKPRPRQSPKPKPKRRKRSRRQRPPKRLRRRPPRRLRPLRQSSPRRKATATPASSPRRSRAVSPRKPASTLARINGSGPHGRVIARDVEEAKSGKGLKAPAAAPAAGAPSIAPSMSDKQILGLYEEGTYDLVPHDGMRRTIAQRLTAATQSMPTFYLTIDCDIGKLTAAREEINAAAPKDKDKKPLYKLSVNDFVIKAMALALQRIPEANVSWSRRRCSSTSIPTSASRSRCRSA